MALFEKENQLDIWNFKLAYLSLVCHYYWSINMSNYIRTQLYSRWVVKLDMLKLGLKWLKGMLLYLVWYLSTNIHDLPRFF